MTFKMVITKAGFNALTEENAKNKIFDASLNHLKTAVSGSFSRELTAGNSTTVSITHNLGYRPLSIAYFNNNANNNWGVPLSAYPNSPAWRHSFAVYVATYCDTTKTYFEIHNSGGATRTINVEYEIFYEGD